MPAVKSDYHKVTEVSRNADEALHEPRPPQAARGEDVLTEVELRQLEAEDGTRRLVNFRAVVRCLACMGRGSVGLADPDCEYCGGTGRRRAVLHLIAANLSEADACSCVREPCPRCGGVGTVPVERRIRFHIPPGVEDGTQLRISGEGDDAGAGSLRGDLLVRVRVVQLPSDPRVVQYAAFLLLLVAMATLVMYAFVR